MNNLRRWALLAVLAVLALIFGLVSCGGDDAADVSGLSGGTEMIAPESMPSTAGDQSRNSLKMDAPMSPPAQPATERQEVVTGWATVITDEPIATSHRAADKVKALGGRIDSQTEEPGNDDIDPTASLTARVPADKTDALVGYLGEIGEVANVNLNRSDVTMQVTDLNARIGALRTSVDRLTQLMTQTGNVADLIAAESALSQRQGELDSLTAQQRQLTEQIDLSTLTINFTTDPKVNPEKPDSFWEGVVAGWHSLTKSLKATVVAFGKAVPWLGLLVVAAAVVIGGLQILSRRRRSREVPSSTPPAAPVAGQRAEVE